MFFRYPGGKKKLKTHIIQKLAEIQVKRQCSSYCEPFFGGGAIGVEFLKLHNIANIKMAIINDKDVGIASLWTSVIRYPNELKNKIQSFHPSIDCFYKYKDILLTTTTCQNDKEFYIDYGFMKLAIHQISYSGLGTKSGSPLGGKEQKSKYKIDCRWSPKHINKKIDELHNLFSQLTIYNNACTCLDFEEVVSDNSITYLDPPYYIKGNELYQHGFTEMDHLRLSKSLRDKCCWALSYDDCEEVRKLYSWAKLDIIKIDYSIRNTTQEKENKKREKKQELLIYVD